MAKRKYKKRAPRPKTTTPVNAFDLKDVEPVINESLLISFKLEQLYSYITQKRRTTFRPSLFLRIKLQALHHRSLQQSHYQSYCNLHSNILNNSKKSHSRQTAIQEHPKHLKTANDE